MNSRSTWIWLFLALVLGAVIFWVEPRWNPPKPPPQPILTGFDLRAVTDITVRLRDSTEIRAEFTNDTWQLVRPVVYPAQAGAISALLTGLQQLTPDTTLGAGLVTERPKAPEEYGISNPQFAITLHEGESRRQLLVGNRTAPGDQVFVQLVGAGDIQVVTAELLKLLPATPDAWRETALLDLRSLKFNRLAITNGPTAIDLQFNPGDQSWRMTRPRQQRADGLRIADIISRLAKLRAAKFVTDDPAADLEQFGLQPAALSVAFLRGTNQSALLQFGKSLTNDAKLIYARRSDYPSVLAVDKELIAPIHAPVEEFRDRHLVSLPHEPDAIQFQSRQPFTLLRLPDNRWRVEGQTFPVDADAVLELFTNLTSMSIVSFAGDVITEPDLPKFGLDAPVRQITLCNAITNSGAVSNVPFLQLAFGTNQGPTIFARRADEDSVYAVALADFEKLPTSALQLRGRKFWSFTEEDVTRVTSLQGGRKRTVVREGTNSWSLAPGSQGIIFGPAIEETVHRIGEMTALDWLEHGTNQLERFGFSTNSLTLQVELKNGRRYSVDFGGPSPAGYPCVAVALDGEPWIGEIPIAVHYLVQTHLALPADKQ